jgi:hypothetical protein
VVQITNFVDSDPEVVRITGEADDAEAAAHALLRIGAQAARIASTDLDTEVVERRFAGMVHGFDATVSKAVAGITGAAEQFFDEDSGTLPRVIAGMTRDLEVLLGDTFNADSKTSVIAKVEQAMTEAAHQVVAQVRSTFNLDQPDSPLARTKRELAEVVRNEVGAVAKEVRDVGLALAAKAAVAEVGGRLTAKGASFEELIAAGVDQIAAIHGDIAERVGMTAGASGTRKGDHLVTICHDDTCGLGARFVLEAKDRGLSMSKTMGELDAAMQNHDASAAIAVFARAELAPITLTFWHSGNRAILVYDKECPDPRALQLAYEWARWVARRSLALDAEASVDVADVEASVTRTRQALDKHQAVKACHSAIRKKAEEAGAHVAGLVDEVDRAMRDLIVAANR